MHLMDVKKLTIRKRIRVISNNGAVVQLQILCIAKRFLNGASPYKYIIVLKLDRVSKLFSLQSEYLQFCFEISIFSSSPPKIDKKLICMQNILCKTFFICVSYFSSSLKHLDFQVAISLFYFGLKITILCKYYILKLVLRFS